MTTAFLVAGEASGDLHGSKLMVALKKRLPDVIFSGVGGPRMREEGLSSLLPMEAFSVMGFTDVVIALPRLYRQFLQVKSAILSERPDVLVLIDMPAFNLRLAGALRKSGYSGKIVQYVSPTVWAHGSDRIYHLAKTVDLLLTIFPFEQELYAGTDLKVVYIGHPTVDYSKEHKYQEGWYKKVGLSNTNNLIAIFPGSRKAEIRHNLKNQLLAIQKLQVMHPDIQIAVSCAYDSLQPLIEQHIASMSHKFPTPITIVPSKYSYELMRSSRVAIAVSGTVTLELALHETPTVVVYHVNLLNRLYAQYVMGLTMTRYCIVNIVANHDVFPELIIDRFHLTTAYAFLEQLYRESTSRRRCLNGCHQVRSALDGNGANTTAANAIVDMIKGTPRG